MTVAVRLDGIPDGARGPPCSRNCLSLASLMGPGCCHENGTILSWASCSSISSIALSSSRSSAVAPSVARPSAGSRCAAGQASAARQVADDRAAEADTLGQGGQPAGPLLAWRLIAYRLAVLGGAIVPWIPLVRRTPHATSVLPIEPIIYAQDNRPGAALPIGRVDAVDLRDHIWLGLCACRRQRLKRR